MAITTCGMDAAVDSAVRTALADHDGDVAVIGVETPTGPSLATVAEGAWGETIATLRSAFFALQGAAAMGEGSAIVVVVPVHALRTSAGCGLAAVAGSFLTTVAQVAAVELGERGIRVNVIAAGPLVGAAPERTADGVPLGRLTQPGDIAGAVRMLASDDAAYVTGTVVAVDGGYQVTKAGGGSPFAG